MLTTIQSAAFEVVRAVIAGGRGLFFESAGAALPVALSEIIRGDDLVPQFGFVGNSYCVTGVLVLGINPGNGNRSSRSAEDSRMMPALHDLASNPSAESYSHAIAAQMLAFPNWKASVELGRELSRVGIHVQAIAYANACPFRAGNGKSADVFPNVKRMRNAASSWVKPLILALKPGVVIAHGRTAAKVLSYAEPGIQPVVFDREQNQVARARKNADFSDRLLAALQTSKSGR